MGYSDPQVGNLNKYVAMVPPAAPIRRYDAGTVTSGLTAAPSGQTGNIGTTYIDVPRIPMPYVGILIRITGTVASTSAVGSRGTLPSEWAQRNGLLTNVEVSMNGGDKFMSIGGGNLWALNRIEAGNRKGEEMGADVVPSATPYSGNSQTFDFSYYIPFTEATFYPRLFSMLNAYEGHGVTQVLVRLDFGNSTAFTTGDTNSSLTGVAVQISYDYVDYNLLPGYGEPYVRETTFCRREIRQLNAISLSNATMQLLANLDRGLYYRSIMVVDLDGTSTNPNANNITAVQLQRDTSDYFYSGTKVPHLQRLNIDKWGTVFQDLNFVYLLDLCPQREVTQLLNTLAMVQWQLFATAGTGSKQCQIVEVMYNIPTARIPAKPSNRIMAASA